MAIDVIIPITLSLASLIISVITAYKTLFQRFNGKVWLGNYIVLSHVNNFPAIILACFFENTGAKLGILDDLRMIVEHQESGASYKFFPTVMKDEYNIFETVDEKDWLAYNGIILPPKSLVQKYVVFKPLFDHFQPQKGSFTLFVQRRWYGSDQWIKLPFSLPFELTDNDIELWFKDKKALSVATKNILSLR